MNILAISQEEIKKGGQKHQEKANTTDSRSKIKRGSLPQDQIHLTQMQMPTATQLATLDP